MAVVDQAGFIVLLNLRAEAQFGYPRDELLGRPVTTIILNNALIVRVKTRDELLREAWRIAVATGEFCKAWIGLVDDTGKKLELAASAGVDPELMAIFNSSFLLSAQAPSAGSLVVQAVRENRVIFSNNAQADQAFLFGDNYAAAEINSTAVLPLFVADKVVGMFALYSREGDFFDDDQLKLLAVLAGDISYSMTSIEKQAQLNYLAYYDFLTGLANRKLFLERVSTHILRAQYDDHKLGLYLFDLEGFKNINDSLGQMAGDSLLKQVAVWLTGQVGDISQVARIDADHFAVVLPMVRGAGDVARSLKRSMSELMEQLFQLNGSTMRISAKVGIALFPEDAVTADQLFKMAEAALKRAKKDGDRYLFYTPEMTHMVASRLSLENRLRGALEKNQFLLHYQPIVNFSSGAVCGAEALLRWNCPGRGLVQPDNFIPILEETGMIHEVGRWVLRQAIDDYLRWRQLGVPDFRIAVNLSQLQLRDPGFLAIVKQLLDVDAHAAAGLELEITEGLVMADVEQNIKSFSALRELGVRISIDDFGTGYSSLSHLTRLPLDTLKIDRSFVKDMTLSSAGHVLVHAIISLAHLLEMNVLAEGVETEEQSDCLKLLNCNEMQGFLFSKPLPADAFEEKMVAANASPLVSRCLSNTSDCPASAG